MSPLNQAADLAYFQELLRKHQDSLVAKQMMEPAQDSFTSMGQPHNATLSPIGGATMPTRQPPVPMANFGGGQGSHGRHFAMQNPASRVAERRNLLFSQKMDMLKAKGYRV